VREQFEVTSNRSSKPSKMPKHNKSGTNWNNEEIATMLGMVNANMEPVEGNFIFNHAGGDRLLPFDNHTMQNIPRSKYSLLYLVIPYYKGTEAIKHSL
jgi:hypothetical protein